MSVIQAGNTTTTSLIYTGDTTGNLVFTTGGANTTALTITNAQAATFAGTLTTASQGIAFASLPTGSVLQVVGSTYSTQTSTSSTSYVSTSLTASITPKFSTSKIFIIVNTAIISTGVPNNDVYLTIYRGASTNLGGGSQSSLTGQESGSTATLWTPASINYLDSPATTSSTAYTLYFKVNGGTGYAFWGPTLSTITLMEIAA